MKKLVHVNALASAVGVALMGIGLSSSVTAAQPSLEAAVSTTAEVSSIGQYIVTFAESGLLRYEGGARNGAQELSATAPKKLGVRKLDAQSPAAKAYASYLDAQRTAHVTEIENRLGRPLDITHTYGVIRNGIAVSLSPNELAAVAATPGVVSVKPVKLYSPDTFRGPKFIGANTIWDGSNVPGGVGVMGKGIKVGIIDMGANSQHPSFANDETCGFNATDKKLYAFDCNTSSAGHCTGPNPEAPAGADEGFSHGVHTASTAAGNTLDNTATPPPDLPDGVTMSGVAPCATVYSYRVSNASGSLPGSAISAAIEAIVTDGLDVANFSIGPTCGGGSPWNDDDRDFLDAIDADVFIAASAGNTRANCTSPVGRVSHVGPWMLTVAASTQDQTIGQGTFKVTGPGTVPPLLQSFGGTKGTTTNMDQVDDLTGYPFRTYPTNIAGCTATGGFPANYFQGAIAVIRRGATPPATEACNFSEKINNAAGAGAVMVVIANNKNDAQGIDTTGSTLPSFKINDLATSDALIAFVNANNGAPVDPDVVFANGFEDVVASGTVGDFVKGASLVTVQGDVLGSFSFRGPTSGAAADVTKPDITAPGVNIYAAGRAADNSYLFMGGTSMASPHVAGAATLVREIHPDWTVAEVKSALMTTSFQAGFQEDGTTQWTPDQVGSGRVDLTKAAKVGLTLDETYQRFVDANPSGGTVAVKDLNIPSVRNSNCQTTCTWTRTVKNRLATSGSWNATATGNGFGLTVSPSSFTLAPGETKELTITANLTAALPVISFGQVDLVEANGQSPSQHITAAVKGTVDAGNAVDLQVDTFSSGGFNLLGSATSNPPLQFLWLNRFTPDPASYPITLTSLETIFGSQTSSGSDGAVMGETFDYYVFQDNDTNPANGATLVGKVEGAAVTVLDDMQSVTIPSPGITLNGPGDVLIGIVNRGRQGHYPASADMGPDAQRSWISGINIITAGDPNLATLNLQKTSAAVSGFTFNWIIRGHGTSAAGQPIHLQ
ncbi:S8 family serine peptidase [Dokdonella sp.]|uniref:S8 family serine peptidase n=1 Tax=Dokdonella sp. TaxID=2291710 RepID=UPI001B1EEE0C|nr:S8 family serine peptidase [Dokdonella sp.]MBO9664711.1 S8 family serine peptidase [Dokdonella sp.]